MRSTESTKKKIDGPQSPSGGCVVPRGEGVGGIGPGTMASPGRTTGAAPAVGGRPAPPPAPASGKAFPRRSSGWERPPTSGGIFLHLLRPQSGRQGLGAAGIGAQSGMTAGRPTAGDPSAGPLLPAPPFRGWARTAERGCADQEEEKNPDGRGKGSGVGAAWTPGLRHTCRGCPGPRSLPSGLEINPEDPSAAPLAGRRAPTASRLSSPVSKRGAQTSYAGPSLDWRRFEGRARGRWIPPCQLRAPLPSSCRPLSAPLPLPLPPGGGPNPPL